jgi:co-chaperonin GroES (HSP10)
MNPLRDFIIHLPKKVNDTVSVGGVELYMETKFDEFNHRYNFAEITAIPTKYKLGAKVGDTLYFHHHIISNPQLVIYENHYIVSYSEEQGYHNHAYAYETEDGLHMLGDWVFVESISEEKEETTASGLVISLSKPEEKEGRLLCINKNTEDMGLKVGDIIGFSKNSDYTMTLKDGRKVWRMRNDDLVYVKESPVQHA